MPEHLPIASVTVFVVVFIFFFILKESHKEFIEVLIIKVSIMIFGP